MNSGYKETNTRSYLGSYDPEVAYKKFDYVYNTIDNCFYYAREDIEPTNEYSETSQFRFSLDINGPLYGGRKSFYLYDHENKIWKNLTESSKITITSYADDDQVVDSGTFLIKKIQESYDPSFVAPQSLLITDILDSQEQSLDKFESSWLFGGGVNFDWHGRDWGKYITMHKDVTLLYEQAISEGYSLGVDQWGLDHYNNYGNVEGKSIPLRSNHQLINLTDVGCKIYASINTESVNKSNITQADKKIWFNFASNVENLYFHASKNRSSSDGTFESDIYFKDSTPAEWHNFWQRENPKYLDSSDGDNAWRNYENLIFSPDRQRIFAANNLSSGLPITAAIDEWVNLDGFWHKNRYYNDEYPGQKIVLSAVSEDCKNYATCHFPGIWSDPLISKPVYSDDPRVDSQWPFPGYAGPRFHTETKSYYRVTNLEPDWDPEDVAYVYIKIYADVIAVHDFDGNEDSESIVGEVTFINHRNVLNVGKLTDNAIKWTEKPVGTPDATVECYRLDYKIEIKWGWYSDQISGTRPPSELANKPFIMPRYEKVRDTLINDGVAEEDIDTKAIEYLREEYYGVHKFLLWFCNGRTTYSTDNFIEHWRKFYPSKYENNELQSLAYVSDKATSYADADPFVYFDISGYYSDKFVKSGSILNPFFAQPGKLKIRSKTDIHGDEISYWRETVIDNQYYNVGKFSKDGSTLVLVSHNHRSSSSIIQGTLEDSDDFHRSLPLELTEDDIELNESGDFLTIGRIAVFKKNEQADWEEVWSSHGTSEAISRKVSADHGGSRVWDEYAPRFDMKRSACPVCISADGNMFAVLSANAFSQHSKGPRGSWFNCYLYKFFKYPEWLDSNKYNKGDIVEYNGVLYGRTSYVIEAEPEVYDSPDIDTDRWNTLENGNPNGTWLRQKNYNPAHNNYPERIDSNFGTYLQENERKDTNIGCTFSADSKYLIISGGKINAEIENDANYAAKIGNLGVFNINSTDLLPANGYQASASIILEDQDQLYYSVPNYAIVPKLEHIKSAQVTNASHDMFFDEKIEWGFYEHQFYGDKSLNRDSSISDKSFGNSFIVSSDHTKPTRILISCQKYNQINPETFSDRFENESRFPLMLFELQEDPMREGGVFWQLISSDKDPHFAWNRFIGGNESLSSLYLCNFIGDNEESSNPYESIYNSSLEWKQNANYNADKKRFALFYSGEKKFSKYKFGAQEGWLKFKKADQSVYPDVAYHIYNFEGQNWWKLLRNNNGITRDASSEFDTPEKINPSETFDEAIDSEIINGARSTRLWIIGDTENDIINNSADLGTKIKVYSEVNEHSIASQSSNNSWVKDKFFFDCDYGSEVEFKANNIVQEYGNGYYKIYPKNINSLEVKFNLKFEARDNQESNAIIHFLENQAVKNIKNDPSENVLSYSQGIEGFQWDGASTFFPYDSTKTQTKKFYCENFSRTLTFENSNDISLSLTNYSSSNIRLRGEGGYIRNAEEYEEGKTYEYGDVVYHAESSRYYYYINSEPSDLDPVRKRDNNSRGLAVGGVTYAGSSNNEWIDVNKQCWSRDFHWRPSLGINVQQSPRFNKIAIGNGYTQLYGDGINESLLKLDLSFNNRNDVDCFGILHFLEQHIGYIPFKFDPPAPYDKESPKSRWFICQEWKHVYSYKNNHSISAKFIEYPISFVSNNYMYNTALLNQGIKDIPAELVGGSRLSVKSVVMAEQNRTSYSGEKFLRHRSSLKNSGGEKMIVSSVVAFAHPEFVDVEQSEGQGLYNIVGNEDFDYANYVNFYPDLYYYWKFYRSSEISLTKFGREHYHHWGSGYLGEYGKKEWRFMPKKNHKFSREFLASAKTRENVKHLYLAMFPITRQGENSVGENEIDGWMNNDNYDNMFQLEEVFMDSKEYRMNFLFPEGNESLSIKWENYYQNRPETYVRKTPGTGGMFSDTEEDGGIWSLSQMQAAAVTEQSVRELYDFMYNREPTQETIDWAINTYPSMYELYAWTRTVTEYVQKNPRVHHAFGTGLYSINKNARGEDLKEEDFIVTLPEEDIYYNENLKNDDINLYGKKILLQPKSYTEGMSGGMSFYTLDENNNKIQKYIQKNDGQIRALGAGSEQITPLETDYFVTKPLVKKQHLYEILPGQEVYYEVTFSAFFDQQINMITDEQLRSLKYLDNSGSGFISSLVYNNKYIGALIIKSQGQERFESQITTWVKK